MKSLEKIAPEWLHVKTFNLKVKKWILRKMRRIKTDDLGNTTYNFIKVSIVQIYIRQVTKSNSCCLHKVGLCVAIITDSKTLNSNSVLHLRRIVKFEFRSVSLTPQDLFNNKCSAIEEHLPAFTRVVDLV